MQKAYVLVGVLFGGILLAMPFRGGQALDSTTPDNESTSSDEGRGKPAVSLSIDNGSRQLPRASDLADDENYLRSEGSGIVTPPSLTADAANGINGRSFVMGGQRWEGASQAVHPDASLPSIGDRYEPLWEAEDVRRRVAAQSSREAESQPRRGWSSDSLEQRGRHTPFAPATENSGRSYDHQQGLSQTDRSHHDEPAHLIAQARLGSQLTQNSGRHLSEGGNRSSASLPTDRQSNSSQDSTNQPPTSHAPSTQRRPPLRQQHDGEPSRLGWQQRNDLGQRPVNYKTYRLRDGDTLPSLATRFLGSANRAAELYELNRDILTQPQVLPLGVEIRVPMEP